jgi:hypothetical protein
MYLADLGSLKAENCKGCNSGFTGRSGINQLCKFFCCSAVPNFNESIFILQAEQKPYGSLANQIFE